MQKLSVDGKVALLMNGVFEDGTPVLDSVNPMPKIWPPLRPNTLGRLRNLIIFRVCEKGRKQTLTGRFLTTVTHAMILRNL